MCVWSINGELQRARSWSGWYTRQHQLGLVDTNKVNCLHTNRNVHKSSSDSSAQILGNASSSRSSNLQKWDNNKKYRTRSVLVLETPARVYYTLASVIQSALIAYPTLPYADGWEVMKCLILLWTCCSNYSSTAPGIRSCSVRTESVVIVVGSPDMSQPWLVVVASILLWLSPHTRTWQSAVHWIHSVLS